MEKTENNFIDVHDLLDQSLSMISLDLRALRKILENCGELDEKSAKKLNDYTRTLTMASRAYNDFDPGSYKDEDLEHLAQKAREAMERKNGQFESND